MEALRSVKQFIRTLEQSHFPFYYYTLSFFASVTVRCFFEIILFGRVFLENIDLTSFLLNFYLSQTCLALIIVIFFCLITKEKIKKIAKAVFPSFLILAAAPIITYFTYFLGNKSSAGCASSYVFGISGGIALEVLLFFLSSFSYLESKRPNKAKNLIVSFLLCMLIMIFYSSVPILMLAGLGSKSSVFTKEFYALLVLPLLSLIFFIFNKNYLHEILLDIRPYRLLHFELMFLMGIVLAEINSNQIFPFLTSENIFHFLFTVSAVLFAWLFSIMTNNLADSSIDKVSNQNRPPISLTIPLSDYQVLACIFFTLSVFYALMAGWGTTLLILVFMGNYFFYSMPPVRFKRVPFFSKILISFNSLVSLMLGSYFITGSFNVPSDIAIYVLVFLTASINFIDIKDYEGDKSAGIPTIPVIMGLPKSKLVIGTFFFVSYAAAYIVFRNLSIMPVLILLGIMQFVLINKEDYREKPVFSLYLASLIGVILYFLKFNLTV